MNWQMGECTWEEPHPPHLWGEVYQSVGGTYSNIWACTGKAEEEE